MTRGGGPTRAPRRHRRVPVDMGVVLEGPAGESHLGTARNLGRDGLFVATPARFPVDTPVRVSLMVRDGEDASLPARPVELPARVRWVADPPAPATWARPAGMGLRFADLEPTVRARLEAILARLYAHPAAGPAGLAAWPARPLA